MDPVRWVKERREEGVSGPLVLVIGPDENTPNVPYDAGEVRVMSYPHHRLFAGAVAVWMSRHARFAYADDRVRVWHEGGRECCGAPQSELCREWCERRKNAEMVRDEALSVVAKHYSCDVAEVAQAYETHWQKQDPTDYERELHGAVYKTIGNVCAKRNLCDHHFVRDICPMCIEEQGERLGIRRAPGETTGELRERTWALLSANTLPVATFNGIPFPSRAIEDVLRAASDRVDVALHARHNEPFPVTNPEDANRLYGRGSMAAGAAKEALRVPIGFAKNSAAKGETMEVDIPPHGFVFRPYDPKKDGAIETRTAQVLDYKRESLSTTEVRAASIRSENLRVADEIAKNPPEWAYPLAWRLAVAAVVEECNARPDPLDVDGVWEKFDVTAYLRTYHDARLRGMTEHAARKHVGDETGYAHAKMIDAYERGRPGPGGVRVGRPAC